MMNVLVFKKILPISTKKYIENSEENIHGDIGAWRFKSNSWTCIQNLAFISVVYLTVTVKMFCRCNFNKMIKVIRDQFLVKFSPEITVEGDSLYIKTSSGVYNKITPPCPCDCHLTLHLSTVSVVFFQLAFSVTYHLHKKVFICAGIEGVWHAVSCMDILSWQSWQCQSGQCSQNLQLLHQEWL